MKAKCELTTKITVVSVNRKEVILQVGEDSPVHLSPKDSIELIFKNEVNGP